MPIFPEDPRTYLRQEYDHRHKRNPAYSWRSFARDLKLSPSMLSEFLKGRYGLSRGKATSVAQAIRLDITNTEHFIDLLEAGFHRLPMHRENARLRADERMRKTTPPKESLRGILDWSFLAMLEIAGVEQGEAKLSGWMAPFKHLHAQAAAALTRLRDLKLVDDLNRPSEEVTVAGDQFGEDDLRSLHAQTLALAGQALDGMTSLERENLSVYGSIRAEDFAEMRKELNDTLVQLLNKYASKPGTDSVYCFAMQAFPIYRRPR